VSDNPAKAYVERVRRARKDHWCDGCQCACIKRGDHYVRISGVWDGGPASYAWCLEMQELAASVKITDYVLVGARAQLVDALAENVLEFSNT